MLSEENVKIFVAGTDHVLPYKKRKVRPKIGHEGPDATPRPLYPRERPDTHCIGGWVGPRSGLDGC